MPSRRREWTPVWSGPRPFVHPLTTPAGALLSCDAPADHPWHHGLWFAIKFVNGENFWEEYGEFGTLDPIDVSDDGTTAHATIAWHRPGSHATVVEEARTMAHVVLDHRRDRGAYAIDWTVSLVPTVDVIFDRTPFTTWGGYGGLTLRGAPDWHDGRIRLLAEGERERVLGERSPWCALEGTAARADGSEGTAGVVVFDHPDNPRFPTPWYASNRADTYGDGWANFVNAAFLWEEPLAVAAGERLVLRHRVVVHDGAWNDATILERYGEWTNG